MGGKGLSIKVPKYTHPIQATGPAGEESKKQRTKTDGPSRSHSTRSGGQVSPLTPGASPLGRSGSLHWALDDRRRKTPKPAKSKEFKLRHSQMLNFQAAQPLPDTIGFQHAAPPPPRYQSHKSSRAASKASSGGGWQNIELNSPSQSSHPQRPKKVAHVARQSNDEVFKLLGRTEAGGQRATNAGKYRVPYQPRTVTWWKVLIVLVLVLGLMGAVFGALLGSKKG